MTSLEQIYAGVSKNMNFSITQGGARPSDVLENVRRDFEHSLVDADKS
jgi:hypothetical protein